MRQERLASAPTITDEAAVLNTIMDYDGSVQPDGNERYFNNGTNTVTVVGGPQPSTELTPNHQSTIAIVAAQQAELADTEAIYMNRPLSSIIPGPDFAPDIEPDIVRVTTGGIIEITEIRSNSQTMGYFRNLFNMVDQQVADYNAANGMNIQVKFNPVINADYTPEMLDTALEQ